MRRCSLAAHSNWLWVRTSAGRIQEKSFFVNGPLAKIRTCSSRTMTLGTRCLSEGSSSLLQDNRIQIHQPRRNLQIKFTRPVGRNEFVAYIDGIGNFYGTRCLLEWKTSASCYPKEPEGLLALDPQLVCYSWMTGISEVAQVVFVRKRLLRRSSNCSEQGRSIRSAPM